VGDRDRAGWIGQQRGGGAGDERRRKREEERCYQAQDSAKQLRTDCRHGLPPSRRSARYALGLSTDASELCSVSRFRLGVCPSPPGHARRSCPTAKYFGSTRTLRANRHPNAGQYKLITKAVKRRL